MVPLALEGCRAWYHPGHRRAGVVLCNALGIEELCARQSYVSLAKLLEERGVHVLRLDYYGTGDSAGDLNEPGLVSRWLRNIETGSRWLERHAGVTDLTFVGLRFGATLAAAAAAARGGVSRLALLSPVMSGRIHARELQLASKMVVTIGAEEGARHNPDPGSDVAGFVFPPDLTAGLRAIDIAALSRAPAARALVMSSGTAAPDDPVSLHLSSIGGAVETAEFPDYDRMMINPTSGHPCVNTMRAVAGWIAAGVAAAEQVGAQDVIAPRDVIEGQGWRETANVFPTENHLVGVLCEPKVKTDEHPCALLLNGGRDSHVGWARGHVELARQMAEAGIASLRFDLTRIADSQPDTSGIRAELYAPSEASGLADVSHALNALEHRGYRRFAVFGSCSGAYLAFKAGLADRRIDTIALRNIQRYVWRLDDRILFPHDERRDSTVGAGQSTATNMRLGAGKASAKSISKAGLRYVRRSIVAASDAVSFLTLDRPRTRQAISKYAGRGGRLLAVYSANDPGRAHLDQLFGKDGKSIACDVAFEFIAGADHNFTSAARRREFGEMFIRTIKRAH